MHAADLGWHDVILLPPRKSRTPAEVEADYVRRWEAKGVRILVEPHRE